LGPDRDPADDPVSDPVSDPVGDAQRSIATGRPGEAVARLQSLLASGRGGLLLRVTLVRALIASDDISSAIATARETALLNPQAAIAAACLGEALLAAGKLATAIGEFQRALRLDPNLVQARVLLGNAWLAAGEAEKALEAYAEIAAADSSPAVTAAIAQGHAMRARPRCDPRYVRHLFDEFSTDYDRRMLGQLAYTAPAILKQLAAMLGIVEDRKFSVLDLGCGTGLAGAAFRAFAQTLAGVDLSPAMIEKARERGIYDRLEVGDLETALFEDGQAFDLILAADTLVYLGDLRAVFAGAARRLAGRGLFLFTVEKSDAADFALGPKRRWRHSQVYLHNEAEHAGLDVAGLLACHPRSEAGVPVEGYAVALQRARSGDILTAP